MIDLNEMGSGGGGFGDLELDEERAAAPAPAARAASRAVAPQSNDAELDIFIPGYESVLALIGDVFGTGASLYLWYLGSGFFAIWLGQLGAKWAGVQVDGMWTAQWAGFIIPIGVTALQRAFMPRRNRSLGSNAFWSAITVIGIYATFKGATPWMIDKIATGAPLVFDFQLDATALAEGVQKLSFFAGAFLVIISAGLEIGPEYGGKYFGTRLWRRAKAIRKYAKINAHIKKQRAASRGSR